MTRLLPSFALAVILTRSAGAAEVAPGAGNPEPSSSAKVAYPFEEEVAPLGTGNPLSDAQIRFCLAQIIRIDATRSVLNRYKSEQVEYFNAMVADYNGRCGHFSYRKGALESAKELVDANRSQIENEARRAHLARFGGDAKADAASVKPLPVLPTQPETKPESPPASPTVPESRRARADQPEPAQRQAKSESQAVPPPVPESRPAPKGKPGATQRQTKPESQAASASVPESRPVPKAQPEAAPLPAKSESQPVSPSVPESRPAPRGQPEVAQLPAKSESQPVSPSVPESRAAPRGQPEVAPLPAKSEARAVSVTAPELQPAPTVPPEAAQPQAKSEPQPVAAIEPESRRATGGQPETAPAASPAKPQSPPTSAAAPESRPVQDAPPAGGSPKTAAPPPKRLAKAVTPKEDGDALARFTKEVQRLGPGVVAQRDYPAEARDKGWEGTVQIEVRYAAGGYIKSIVVGESSGHALLDEKAGELARALQLPDVPEELQSRDFTVRVPVSFRLR